MKLKFTFFILSTFLVGSFIQVQAQTEGATVSKADWEVVNTENFSNSVNGTCTNNNLVKLADGVTAALVKNDKDEFAVATIAPDMSFKWRTTLSGRPSILCKFKGNLLVVANGRSEVVGKAGGYVAYLLNPDNGKVLLEKQIFSNNEIFVEFKNFFFTENGDYFKFSVRESKIKSGTKMALPGIASLISLKGIDNRYGETQSFKVITLDDKLNATSQELVMPEGTFIGTIANAKGDVFVMTIKDKMDILTSQYLSGQKQASKTIKQALDGELKGFFVNSGLTENFYYTDSKKYPNQLYWALSIREGKTSNVYLSLVDFDKGISQIKKETFTKDEYEDLEKNYKPIDKKVSEPKLGSAANQSILDFFTTGDKIIVEVGGSFIQAGQYGSTIIKTSVVLNVFDMNLNLKSQQIIPRYLPVVNRLDFDKISYDYQEDTNRLRFLANTFKGMASNIAMYGEMDMVSCKIDRLKYLGMSKVGSRSYVNGPSVFWSKQSFIIPYFEPKGLTQTKYDIYLKDYKY